jgi:hypothetical protein
LSFSDVEYVIDYINLIEASLLGGIFNLVISFYKIYIFMFSDTRTNCVNNVGLVLLKYFSAFLIGGLGEGMDFALR